MRTIFVFSLRNGSAPLKALGSMIALSPLLASPALLAVSNPAVAQGTTPSTFVASANCSLSAAAFCETFNQGPSAIRGRGGDLDPSKWATARLSGEIMSSAQGAANPEIFRMKADGTGQTNLSNNPATDTFPTFSPDGTWIAFTSNRDGNPEIYAMPANGQGSANLTKSPAEDQFPVWR